MKNNISSNLQDLLRKEQLNARELAKITGVSQQVIYKLINGINTNPTLDTLLPIANYFQIPLHDLITQEGLTKNQDPQLEAKRVPFVTFKEMKQLGIDNAVMNAKKFISFDTESSENNYYFATAMYDDSMEPKFSKGTLLVFEKTKHVINGDFCIIHDNETNFVFRQILINRRDQKFIKCLNPNYEEFDALPLAVNYFVLATLLQARTDFST